MKLAHVNIWFCSDVFYQHLPIESTNVQHGQSILFSAENKFYIVTNK
jgi:hypothetical protein